MANHKAFTLLEALLSLILTSIIIGLTYSLITLIGRQLSLFEEDNTQVVQYNLFNSALMRDINNSVGFDNSGSALSLTYYDNSKITYSIDNNYVLRQANGSKADTFKLKTANPLFTEGALQLNIKLLNDTIQAHYILKRNTAHDINQKLFYESP